MSAPHERFRAYMPEPVIDAQVSVKYASPELTSQLTEQARNGATTWGALLAVLGLSPDSPVLLSDATVYVMPDHTDVSLSLRTRKGF